MTDHQLPISHQRRLVEITAVILTAIGKFVFINYLEWRLPFIAVAILGWMGYIIIRGREQPGILPHWGFRLDNFNKVLRMVLPFGVTAIVVFGIIAWYNDTLNVTWHILPILVLYPLWGVIQHYLLITLTAGNLQEMKIPGLGKGLIILLAAFLFAIVHYPFLWLMGGTFILALFYCWIYLRERNLYVLGLFHGWLAAIFYYTVLERDPYLEIFGG